MKLRALLVLVLVPLAPTVRADDPLDRLGQALTIAGGDGNWRAHASGMIDLEGYALPHPAPGVIDAEGHYLFNPRLTIGLDAQLGERIYAFGQARIDRGFDPSPDPLEARLDEYALRWTPDPRGRLSVQVGKFATVVGNWTTRHDAWTNPFITAPLPYEHLTGVWDNEPPHSVNQLLMWSHMRRGLSPEIEESEKYLRLPIIWGPSYTAGVAVAGEIEKFRYAFEVKNASLSSRPDAWSVREAHWDHPTLSGRIRYVPSPTWEFGWSASTGTFLRPLATHAIPKAFHRGDYQEVVLGQDVSYAWHHLQVWAEVYAARFRLPGIGNADTLAYYVEAKYKLTPEWSGAVRWNQQLFGNLRERGTSLRWGRDLWRVDFAPTYRMSAHTQLKLQYSLQKGDPSNDLTHFVGVQATLRF